MGWFIFHLVFGVGVESVVDTVQIFVMGLFLILWMTIVFWDIGATNRRLSNWKLVHRTFFKVVVPRKWLIFNRWNKLTIIFFFSYRRSLDKRQFKGTLIVKIAVLLLLCLCDSFRSRIVFSRIEKLLLLFICNMVPVWSVMHFLDFCNLRFWKFRTRSANFNFALNNLFDFFKISWLRFGLFCCLPRTLHLVECSLMPEQDFISGESFIRLQQLLRASQDLLLLIFTFSDDIVFLIFSLHGFLYIFCLLNAFETCIGWCLIISQGSFCFFGRGLDASGLETLSRACCGISFRMDWIQIIDSRWSVGRNRLRDLGFFSFFSAYSGKRCRNLFSKQTRVLKEALGTHIKFFNNSTIT